MMRDLTPDQMRAEAAKAVTFAKFMKATGWDIHAVRAANERLGLGLVPIRTSGGKPPPGVPVPKPKSVKGGKGE